MRKTRNVVVAMTVVGAVLLLPGIAAAQAEDGQNDLVVLTGGAEVREGETVDSVVVFDGAATIDGTVNGAVVVFNGPVTISGTVAESVVAFNGLATVRSGAEIGDDLVTRQRAVVEEGAVVRGEIRSDVGSLFREPFPFFGYLAAWLAISVSVLILGLLILLLAPRAGDAVAEAARTAIGPTIGWGLLVVIGLPLFAVLLLITLVGIPFGVGLGLALFLIYAVGYAMGAVVVGRWILKPPRSVIVAFLVGLGILRLLALIPIVAGIVGFAAAVIGLGAMAVAIWRARRPGPAAVPAQA
jgi:hypothetical protein